MYKPTDIQTLYIDFDCFFASVEQQFRPKLRGKPMGVLPLDSKYSGFIAVSREAKLLGIKRGARLVDVQETWPGFPAVIARHDVYMQVHHEILAAMDTVLPVHKVWSVDEVECTLMGREKDNWQDIAAQVRTTLALAIGPYITPSIGFGANQLLAKIAAEMDKPNGLVCLHPRNMPQAIHNIKMSDIPGIGKRMGRRLEKAGITTMPQLLRLSGKQMRGLWGSVEGERLWAGLQGYALEKPKTKRGMFGHGRILSPDWRNRRGVRDCARLLLVKAARRLRRQDYAAGRLSISVGFQDRGRLSREYTLTPPAYDDQRLLQALETLLGPLWQSAPPAQPFKVSVCLSSIVPLHTRVEDLLEQETDRTRRRQWEHLSSVLDKLNVRYGATVVSQGTHIEPPGGYAGGKIAFGRIPDKEDFM
jgi:DNA polymerase IV